MAKKRTYRVRGKILTWDMIYVMDLICFNRYEKLIFSETLSDIKKRKMYERGKISKLGRNFGKFRYIEVMGTDREQMQKIHDRIAYLLVSDASSI